MKRSPTPSFSCSSSSSSSCPGPPILKQNKPKATRKNKRNPPDQKCQKPSTPASVAGGRRSSIYRGVTRHRWTGRFEAHLWDKSSWNNIQNKKGRQVYLGAYDSEEAAAHTYDLAALKYWGPDTTLNFPIETYAKQLEEMQSGSREEYLASLRRQSSGFSRGVSKYRGVARHHHNGRWEARIGRVFGNKYLYLGTYNTQEEAAAAYDIAAIEYRGANAVTNFDISNYIDRFKRKVHPLDNQDQSEDTPTKRSNIEPPKEDEVHQLQPQQKKEQNQEEKVSPQVLQYPHLLQLQPKQKQEQKQEQTVSPQLQYPHLLNCCIESNTMDHVMDTADEHKFDWNFLDAGLMMNQLPVPDIPLDNKPLELPDLFEDLGFEENFDIIFGAAAADATLGGLMESGDCGVQAGVGVPRSLKNNGSSTSSSSSSPSSTTTYVSM